MAHAVNAKGKSSLIKNHKSANWFSQQTHKSCNILYKVLLENVLRISILSNALITDSQWLFMKEGETNASKFVFY